MAAAAAGGSTVLVTLGTGKIGTQLVRELLGGGDEAKGIKVRAGTRRPDSAKAKALAGLGAEIVKVDYDEADSLSAAMKGVDRVVLLTTGPLAQDHLAKWLQAVRDAKTVKHLVRVSAYKADEPTCDLQKQHALGEVLAKATDIPTTVLRPGLFMDNLLDQWSQGMLATGMLQWALKADHKVPIIACSDIARVIAKSLRAEPASTEFNLPGDEALSMNEMVAAVNKVLGTKYEYAFFEPSVFAVGLTRVGVPEAFAEMLADFFDSVNKTEIKPTSGVKDAIGQAPVTWDAFVNSDETKAAFQKKKK